MKIKNILFILLAIFAFSACDDDTEPRLVVDGVIILDPIAKDPIELTKDNLKKVVLNLKWSGVDANVNFESRYAIQIDTLGGDFSNGQLFGDVTELSIDVIGSVLNDVIVKGLKQTPEVAVNYELRMVLAARNKNGVLVVVPGSESASQEIQITASYTAPDELFMIGTDPFGGWNWDSKKVVTMTPVNGKLGEFWAIKYITTADKFKWAPAKEWKNDFAKLEQLEGYSLAEDGNGIVAEDGLYMIYINYLEGKITIEPAKISGIGNCFGSWNEGVALFTIEGNLAKITTKAAGELRIAAGSTAQTSDWWTREFILRAGVIEYRGNGGDQNPRVEVEAGKVITLNFNENTGTIE